MRKLCLSVILALVFFWLYGMDQPILPADSAAVLPDEARYVALTFDDGPRLGTTDRLLDGLKERGASATFFLVGEQAALYPQLVKRMQEEGHQVGNHTWSHVHLEENDDENLQEIEKTELLLKNILDGSHYWLRPPYGLINDGLSKRIHVPMAKWSVDPRDWESRDAEKIIQAVKSNVKENDIILLHDIYEPSVEAALRLVDELQSEGYLFVTVEELLGLNGIEGETGVMYRTGNGK